MQRSVSERLSDNAPSEPSQRRLQRAPDFTGNQLNHFKDVVIRHGLPGAAFGFLCLLHPDVRELLALSLTPAISQPFTYLAVGLVVFVLLCAVSLFMDRGFIDQLKLLWVLYLLGISLWEEFAFRVAIPVILTEFELDFRIAVVISNGLFGLVHYFTLRWKWQWCFAAFLGGMALSRQFAESGDLALIVAIHWIATFINTPRYPGQNRVNR